LMLQVQSARVIRAILQYAGIWWFRSQANPSMAMEALIQQIEGKLKPCSEMGSVAILVLKIHGKPDVACTFAAMTLLSLSASASVIG